MGRHYPDEIAERRRAKRSERDAWHAEIEADDTEDEALDNLADAIEAIRRVDDR